MFALGHGTSGIIASRDVAMGEIVAPMVQPTRTEEDFAEHIKNVVNRNPDDKNIFVTDNLRERKEIKLNIAQDFCPRTRRQKPRAPIGA